MLQYDELIVWLKFDPCTEMVIPSLIPSAKNLILIYSRALCKRQVNDLLIKKN